MIDWGCGKGVNILYTLANQIDSKFVSPNRLQMKQETAERNQLLAEIELLRADKKHLEQMLSSARTSTTALLATCEEAQEGISNRLLREIERLQSGRAAMCEAVEAEEAQLVDVLERRLTMLKNEKVDLENALEQEQERIVNRLQRQMDDLRNSLCGGNGHASGVDSVVQPGSTIMLPSVNSSAITTPFLVNTENGELVSEREAELKRQIGQLMEENQRLLMENVALKNRMRRHSVDESEIRVYSNRPTSFAGSGSESIAEENM